MNEYLTAIDLYLTSKANIRRFYHDEDGNADERSLNVLFIHAMQKSVLERKKKRSLHIFK